MMESALEIWQRTGKQSQRERQTRMRKIKWRCVTAAATNVCSVHSTGGVCAFAVSKSGFASADITVAGRDLTGCRLPAGSDLGGPLPQENGQESLQRGPHTITADGRALNDTTQRLVLPTAYGVRGYSTEYAQPTVPRSTQLSPFRLRSWVISGVVV